MSNEVSRRFASHNTQTILRAKVVVVGAAAVGKTTLLRTFNNDASNSDLRHYKMTARTEVVVGRRMPVNEHVQVRSSLALPVPRVAFPCSGPVCFALSCCALLSSTSLFLSLSFAIFSSPLRSSALLCSPLHSSVLHLKPLRSSVLLLHSTALLFRSSCTPPPPSCTPPRSFRPTLQVEFHFYDCGGSTIFNFKQEAAQYWEDPEFVVVVYDVADKESFRFVEACHKSVCATCGTRSLPGLLVANKTDLSISYVSESLHAPTCK